ncbi:hypothetical protein NDU88_000227 [Pleurodeles waltl]|uniref:Uncharacterized protein n=1 Tax=Pleurodeles waltl TaxID=8319 RepID=A0AAV7WEW1_PLEWA|nr:hypothetical protein NDU88_000227 [Pleurodeles waltl]
MVLTAVPIIKVGDPGRMRRGSRPSTIDAVVRTMVVLTAASVMEVADPRCDRPWSPISSIYSIVRTMRS